MSAPYPPGPRKLTRSTTNRLIGGVCGGLADYLNMDATLVRILTVLVSLFTGVPVILYIIALFLIPEDTATSAPSYPPVTGVQDAPSYQTSAAPPAEPAYAPFPEATPTPTPQRSTADDAIWGTEGPPWEQRDAESAPGGSAAQPASPAQPEAVDEPAGVTEPEAAAEPAAAQPVAPSEPEAPVVPPERSDGTPAS
jgi:phage shock protein PspC (stress-responsive transcriptional regulator)